MASERKAKPHLEPHNISDTVWWYEDHGGIDVIHHIRVDGRWVRTDQIRIPWRTLIPAMERCRPLKPRARVRRKK